jgi:hypothetical protein
VSAAVKAGRRQGRPSQESVWVRERYIPATGNRKEIVAVAYSAELATHIFRLKAHANVGGYEYKRPWSMTWKGVLAAGMRRLVS